MICGLPPQGGRGGPPAPTDRPLHLRCSTASVDPIFYIDSPFAFAFAHQVECFLSILARRLLRHGAFSDPEDLAAQMLAFVEHYNLTAQPFNWTYTGKVLTSPHEAKN